MKTRLLLGQREPETPKRKLVHLPEVCHDRLWRESRNIGAGKSDIIPCKSQRSRPFEDQGSRIFQTNLSQSAKVVLEDHEEYLNSKFCEMSLYKILFWRLIIVQGVEYLLATLKHFLHFFRNFSQQVLVPSKILTFHELWKFKASATREAGFFIFSSIL